MGARGPAPAPTALRVLKGEKPSRINTREPVAPAGVPRPPQWMTRPVARRVWRDTVRVLAPMRVVTLTDQYWLAVYCDSMADYIAASELIEEHGILVNGRTWVPKDGEAELATTLVRNPALMAKHQAFARAQRLAAKFGLTPADRVSLVAGPAADDNDSLLS